MHALEKAERKYGKPNIKIDPKKFATNVVGAPKRKPMKSMTQT